VSTAGLRRWALVLGVVATVVAGAPGTASARFTASVVAPVSVGTATIAPPTGTSTAGSTSCSLLTTGYTVRVGWTASTTARVTGYRVTETVNGTARPVVTVGGTSTSRAATKAVLSTATHSFSVVAVTDYGWLSVPGTVTYTC
jgi:hypothetical protein